jgi:hypothetical protein
MSYVVRTRLHRALLRRMARVWDLSVHHGELTRLGKFLHKSLRGPISFRHLYSIQYFCGQTSVMPPSCDAIYFDLALAGTTELVRHSYSGMCGHAAPC